ncbi:putative acetyltransferase [Escherichia coli]|uniref:Putative acetyltransferase n=1 Tax=Escherichia coli TaxID=562 RepID=A0A377CWX0_ECOLX|nr:putative acetyltransferase [Escherichia coli]
MVISIRRSRHEEGEELVAIWCRSVDATHDFLSAEYRTELEDLVRSFLPEAPLWVAVNERESAGWIYVAKWAAYGCAVYRS